MIIRDYDTLFRDKEFIIRLARGLNDAPEAEQIRIMVFMMEQGFRNEFDEMDPTAIHLLVMDRYVPIATGRIYQKPDAEKTAIIGRIAVVQSRPRPFDRDACLAGAVEAIERVAQERPSDLVVLPELLIPGYPHGLTFGFVVGAREPGSRELWKRYYDGSVVVGGPECQALADAARRTGAWVSVGVCSVK